MWAATGTRAGDDLEMAVTVEVTEGDVDTARERRVVGVEVALDLGVGGLELGDVGTATGTRPGGDQVLLGNRPRRFVLAETDEDDHRDDREYDRAEPT
jgi:hypothetical protein